MESSFEATTYNIHKVEEIGLEMVEKLRPEYLIVTSLSYTDYEGELGYFHSDGRRERRQALEKSVGRKYRLLKTVSPAFGLHNFSPHLLNDDYRRIKEIPFNAGPLSPGPEIKIWKRLCAGRRGSPRSEKGPVNALEGQEIVRATVMPGPLSGPGLPPPESKPFCRRSLEGAPEKEGDEVPPDILGRVKYLVERQGLRLKFNFSPKFERRNRPDSIRELLPMPDDSSGDVPSPGNEFVLPPGQESVAPFVLHQKIHVDHRRDFGDEKEHFLGKAFRRFLDLGIQGFDKYFHFHFKSGNSH